jgi:hypothetical protein
MKKRTRIVPSLVVTASFVGVIPMCAMQACGGSTTSQDGGEDAKVDQILAVACCFGVADGAFGVADVGFGVADVGFVPDAPTDVKEGG